MVEFQQRIFAVGAFMLQSWLRSYLQREMLSSGEGLLVSVERLDISKESSNLEHSRWKTTSWK